MAIVALCMMAAFLIAQANTPSSASPSPSSAPTVRLSAYFQGQQQEPSAFDPDSTPTEPPTPFPLLITNVEGRFFSFPNGGTPVGTFIATTATPPVFTQQFPVIAFNPPADAHVGCTTTPLIDEFATPFTDVIPGTPCGLQPAQAIVTTTPGTTAVVQARVGALEYFQAEFTGNIAVPAAGHVTFQVYSDDGWILGIGSNLAQPTVTALPTLVACPDCLPALPPATPPSTWPITPFRNYPVIGRFDAISGPDVRLVEVSFPAAGTYPFELDYFQGAPTQATLLFGSSAGNPIPPGPTDTPTAINTPTPTNTPTHAVTCTSSSYWCTSISPNINPDSNELHGVAAITKDDIWAVGSHSQYIGSDSLVEHWNGSAWSIVTVTPVGALYGVAKVRTVLPTPEIWAVGDNGILHYANATWSVDTSILSKDIPVTSMRGVVAPSSNEVWVVGNLIKRWDGSSWSTPVASDGLLEGVTWASSSDVRAVGFRGSAPNRTPIVMQWDGSQWSDQTIPMFSGDAFLNSVDLFDINNIWAVGAYADPNHPNYYHTLTLHWDTARSSWQQIPSPDGGPSSVYNELRSVWYNDEGDLWAVGTTSDISSSSGLHTFILRWTDREWQRVDSPNLGANSELLGVGTTSGKPVLVPNPPPGLGNPVFTNSAWAVGRYQDAGACCYGTLIEHISALTPTAYASPQSTSYYEHSGDLNTHYQQGCDAAINHYSGIIVLDYGEPVDAYIGPARVYGSLPPRAPGKPYATITVPQIIDAANHFVDGYYEAFYTPSSLGCPQGSTAPGTPEAIVLGLGINNYATPRANVDIELTGGHAQAWANAVETVQAHVANLPTPLPRLTIAAAVDFEPDWSYYDNTPVPGQSPNNPRTWAKVYGKAAISDYYNFGSTDGYPALSPGDPTPPAPPPFQPCCSAWTAQQLYEISWTMPGARVLPEIYEPQRARNWYQVKRWGYEHNYVSGPIVGTMTQCGDGGCASPTFNWIQAWQVLWLELNADRDSSIHQYLDFSTDIRQ